MNESAQESIPPLPIRGVISNQAIALAQAVWYDARCTDLIVLERIAAGLRAEQPAPQTHVQHEIDSVIARHRAKHCRAR